MALQRMLMGGILLIFLLMGCAAPVVRVIPTTTPPPTIELPTPAPTQPADPTLALPSPTPLPGATPLPKIPQPDDYFWREVGLGFARPVDLVDVGDGSGLLVVEQEGYLRWLVDGQSLETPFLDLSGRVSTGGSEQGLLGLALHPKYAENRLFYVNYTDRRGDTVLAQFQADAAGRSVDPQTEQILLRVNQPYANHNGGGLAFGPDGYLYVALGDGGSAGDPQGNAKNPERLLGKLLRLAVDGQGGYAIPFDNPFAGGGGQPEVWALGLRNPWRFSFDRLTGDLYIADVGQNRWEEVNFLPAGSPGGAHFGWNFREGRNPYQGEPDRSIELIDPVWEYSHDLGCSVTGGFVYRGAAFPEWQGVYFVGDYCNGRVWGLLNNAGTWMVQPLFEVSDTISAFGQDANGELYLLGHRTGTIYRLDRR